MSAFGGKADIPIQERHVRRLLTTWRSFERPTPGSIRSSHNNIHYLVEVANDDDHDSDGVER